MHGREGAGKDGFIAFDSACSISPYNPVSHYNVDICANNEEQAVTPVKDLAEVLETPTYEAKLKKHFTIPKELIQGRKNKGVMKGRTNNPKGRDGMRSGKVIFNEVHQFENYDNIKVFITGQGKVAQPRVGIFTSNGEVSDGPLDDYLARGRRILLRGSRTTDFCPLSAAGDAGSRCTIRETGTWQTRPSSTYRSFCRKPRMNTGIGGSIPEQNGDFLTKRMGLRAGQKEISVTDYEKIKATNRPLPDMSGWSCTVGLDYAELNDWAAVNLHFRRGNERYDINRSWVCSQSRTLSRVKAPWQEWGRRDLITIVDDVSISPVMLAEYIREMGRRYNIKMLAMDHFRWTLVSEAMQAVGFDARDKDRVKLIRPSDIMMVEPVIQECFDRQYFAWGDNPPLRWAVNNTKRVRSSKRRAWTQAIISMPKSREKAERPTHLWRLWQV